MFRGLTVVKRAAGTKGFRLENSCHEFFSRCDWGNKSFSGVLSEFTTSCNSKMLSFNKEEIIENCSVELSFIEMTDGLVHSMSILFYESMDFVGN